MHCSPPILIYWYPINFYNRNYISHLQGEVMADLYNHRVKRQAGTMGMLPRKNLPVRKEIRMMTERERALFFKAVNSAKRNTVSDLNLILRKCKRSVFEPVLSDQRVRCPSEEIVKPWLSTERQVNTKTYLYSFDTLNPTFI